MRIPPPEYLREEREVANVVKGVVGTLLVLFVGALVIAALFPAKDNAKSPPAQTTTRTKENAQENKQQGPKDNSNQEQAIAKANAQAYYDAAEAGNYVYTYSNLTKVDQDSFTRDEWVKANQLLHSDLATYTINGVRMKDTATAEVYLTITGSEGSVSQRHTQFVLEGGATYKHHLTTEEYAMFSDALASGSSSATTSATASAPAGGGYEPATATASATASAPAGGGGDGRTSGMTP